MVTKLFLTECKYGPSVLVVGVGQECVNEGKK